jgi:CubicO group peptidase (beta-lactamase class C family)
LPVLLCAVREALEQWWTRGNGSFAAEGIYGQLINLDPARKLVVVVNSAWTAATG